MNTRNMYNSHHFSNCETYNYFRYGIESSLNVSHYSFIFSLTVIITINNINPSTFTTIHNTNDLIIPLLTLMLLPKPLLNSYPTIRSYESYDFIPFSLAMTYLIMLID